MVEKITSPKDLLQYCRDNPIAKIYLDNDSVSVQDMNNPNLRTDVHPDSLLRYLININGIIYREV